MRKRKDNILRDRPIENIFSKILSYNPTAVLEKTLESPLDCKIEQVHPKGNQS